MNTSEEGFYNHSFEETKANINRMYTQKVTIHEIGREMKKLSFWEKLSQSEGASLQFFLKSALILQQERIVEELEEKLKRPSGNTNAADFYNTGILDAIEVVKSLS